jgi:hypothetical protein
MQIDRGSSPDGAKLKTIQLVYDALRRKSKDWMPRNQDNMSGWGGMSIRGLLFQ